MISVNKINRVVALNSLLLFDHAQVWSLRGPRIDLQVENISARILQSNPCCQDYLFRTFLLFIV